MSAGPSYLDRKNLSAARAGVSQSQGAPGSPYTPRRNPPSTFSSPGGPIRVDEEFVVVELGSRHAVFGLAGDSNPKCILGFSQEESRRVGDFRRWLPSFSELPTLATKAATWGQEHELWRMDLKDIDLGLVEDKLERVTREAYSRYLLQDAKSKRMVLVLPSVLPHSLLASILTIVFRNFQIPGVILLPSPTIVTFAAAQRCALVVDIGWHETIVTAVYEFREVKHGRTTRAMRRITLAMAQAIDQLSKNEPVAPKENVSDLPLIQFDFEFAEDFTTRLAWCPPKIAEESQVNPVSEVKHRLKSMNLDQSGSAHADNSSSVLMLEVPRGPSDRRMVEVAFQDLSKPLECIMFPTEADLIALDDEENTVQHLIYDVLTSLAPDVRSVCMSNIVFTGGGSGVPGLKTRIMEELNGIVDLNGWDLVSGRAADKRRQRLKEIERKRQANSEHRAARSSEASQEGDSEGHTEPAAFIEPEPDYIYEKIRKAAAKISVDQPSGGLRSVETLGAWAGASMAASLKLKGVVEIERELYMMHGLAGAHREGELSNPTRSRQSVGPNVSRPSAQDGSAWTLGLWSA